MIINIKKHNKNNGMLINMFHLFVHSTLLFVALALNHL